MSDRICPGRAGFPLARAAALISVPERTLRRWCPDLDAAFRRKPGGPWLIDPEYVRTYRAAREACETAAETIPGHERPTPANPGHLPMDARAARG